MAKDSVYSILQHPVTEHGRNVFPLDNRQIYSMKAGQITPIKALHYKPGDYFDIQAHDFSMTFPMNTAAFLRGRKEFSFYSVYYNAIWSLFNQYQATRENPKTSAFDGNGKLVEPRIPLFDLLFNCWGQWIKYMYYEYYLSYYTDVDPLSGGDLSLVRQSWLDSLDSYDVWYLAQNVVIYSVSATHFNNVLSNAAQSSLLSRTDFVYSSSNFKMREYVLDIVGHFRAYSWLRKLDMLGYGNYYPLFSAAEASIVNLTAPTDSATLATWLESACDIMLDLLCTLADSCWKYSANSLASLTAIDDEKHYNLYPICAYNSIFYHFFRNSYYDNDYYSHDYSLDFVSVANNFGSYNIVHPNNFSARFLDIEYHQWKKDRFTAVLPDQQFGSVSGLTLSTHPDVTSSDERRWDHSDGTPLSSTASASVASWDVGSLVDTVVTKEMRHTHLIPANQVGFDVIALKRAEMLQEYRQLLMRAGNKTTDIFRAIYGESCSSEHVDDIIPRFMDTFGEDIFVDPVQATAQTGSGANQTLGDLSARGKFSGSSGRVKFNAGGNFGVILCLAYVIPTSEYNSYIVDRHLMELSPNAHFIPQFENLGLDDIYNFELNCLLPYNEMQSIGKAPRYFHKKTEVDMVHGAFCSLSKNIMAGMSVQSFLLNAQYGGWFGSFNHWVSPRTELQGRVSTALRDFYVNPSVLDNVFVQAAGADQSQDQFICNTYLEIRSTKEMTKIGLPNFV